MPRTCSFDDLSAFIREVTGISGTKEITESSVLERDLGVTGDDGDELLEAIQERFGVSFIGDDGAIRDLFGLQKGEYLFHGEGAGLFQWIASWFGVAVENVRQTSVGDLYRAMLKASEKVPARL